MTRDERQARLAARDAAIARGLADAAAGRTKPAEEVFDRLEAAYQARLLAAREDEEDAQAFIDSISEF